MKSIIVIPIVIVTIVAIVVCLVAYSYTQIQINLNDISFAGLDWAPTSGLSLLKLTINAIAGNVLGTILSLVTGVKLNLIFALSNHGIFPVYIPNLSYILSINNVQVGQGQSNVDTTINPGETKNMPILQDIKINSLEPTASSIINSGGMINLQVSGTAYFKLLGITIPIPFQSAKQFSIVDEVKNKINNVVSQNQYSNNQYSNNTPQGFTSLGQQLQEARQKVQAVQQNYQPPPPSPTVSVYADRTSYNRGDTITVQGIVNLIIPNQFVIIHIQNHVGEVISDRAIAPNPNGEYEIHITLNSLLSDGKYVIIANYGSVQSQTTFVLGS